MTENRVEKQAHGFRPGQSGNPAGRPRGARNKATLAVEALLEGEAEALSRKAIELALAGDTMALRLCLERIVPARRERLAPFALPTLAEAADARDAMAAVLGAAAEGELTPGEGAVIAKLITDFADIDLTTEVERISEKKKNGLLQP
jgi:hypothetical protein